MSRPMVVGCTRIKNGERYVDRWVHDMLGMCDALCILDDGSTDKTVEKLSTWAKQHTNIFLHLQKNLSRNGGRDCITLYKMAASLKADWIFAPDVDEFVDMEDISLFSQLIVRNQEDILGWTFPFFYYWDSEQQYRTDGDYYRCHVIRLFKYDEKLLPENQIAHSQLCPVGVDRRRIRSAPVRIVHYGYMDSAERQTKFEYYTGRDKDPLKAGAGVKNYAHITAKAETLTYPTRKLWKRTHDLAVKNIPDDRVHEIIGVPQ